MDTSIKVSQEELIRLNELKTHLLRRGIKVSQKNLLDESIKFAIENETELINRLKKKKDNTKEMTEKFLKSIQPVDLDKNWMEEIDLL